MVNLNVEEMNYLERKFFADFCLHRAMASRHFIHLTILLLSHKQTFSSNKQLWRSCKRIWSNKVIETRSRNEKFRRNEYEIKTIKNELINEFLTGSLRSSSSTTSTVTEWKENENNNEKRIVVLSLDIWGLPALLLMYNNFQLQIFL